MWCSFILLEESAPKYYMAKTLNKSSQLAPDVGLKPERHWTDLNFELEMKTGLTSTSNAEKMLNIGSLTLQLDINIVYVLMLKSYIVCKLML